MPIYLCLIIFVLGISPSIFASPAARAMIDGNGCHVCQKSCTSFGLERGMKHCHVFTPESIEIYTKSAAGAAGNSEAMYADNILKAMDYISLDPENSQIIVGSADDNHSGSFKVINQSCGFGNEELTITEGAPVAISRIFGTNLPSDKKGIYSVSLQGKSYLAIETANQRFVVIGGDDDIKCSGQFIKKSLYLYCKAEVSGKKYVAKGGYCRTLFEK